MFAGAAREVVFADPNVVATINAGFIPVALKAAEVANPPAGVTGDLYRELKRTQPAPQGICIMNSAGKVLDWVLAFENQSDIPKYFDDAASRYKSHAFADSVAARRFRTYPPARLPDVPDAGVRFDFPLNADTQPVTTAPQYAPGSLVGKVIGRPLGENGQPVARTLRQEDYMESTFAVSPQAVADLLQMAGRTDEEFEVPNHVVRQLVGPAYLGQLDVSPLLEKGTANQRSHWWQFRARRKQEEGRDVIRITGRSAISAAGRVWNHSVTLQWQGFVEIHQGQATALEMLATGHEQLQWGAGDVTLQTEPDARHLMAGHPIDLDSRVIYGLTARRR